MWPIHGQAHADDDGPAAESAELDIAVVDVETTGFSPRLNDRIVEIAVVRMSATGEVVGEYETLVNPERDVGPTHVHGIAARDVPEAPTFAELAGEVATRLQGAIFVGHNVAFDSRFVASEFGRLGHSVDVTPRLCTMHLAGASGLAARSLDACCHECGITLARHHAALADARATAELLMLLLGRCRLTARDAAAAQNGGLYAPANVWPRIEIRTRGLTRSDSKARLATANSYVVELVRRISAEGLGGAAETVAYTDLLDRVLEDRTVTLAEVEGLHEMAVSLGMTAQQVFDAHWRYLEALASMALSGGSISDQERADLRRVGALLGLECETTDGIVMSCAASDDRAPTCTPRKSLDGCSVCFTGQLARTVDGLPIERAQAEAIARSAGLTVKSGVSKRLDVLVCADPDSCSVKARKARDYGVRIMAEQAFWRALGK
ncbi:MAG TPA: exonuclease domain-containing protein [Thermoleophilia bacterium]|nr:exonuclease domain-containing protein [Thermoleophilia bacterium]